MARNELLQVPEIDLANPLSPDVLAEDYQTATVSVVYSRVTGQRLLLFAVVELWTQWHEVPSDSEDCLKVNGTATEFNFRRWHLAPLDALSWYRSLTPDGALLPPSTHPRATSEPLKLAVPALGDQPEWPAMTVVHAGTPSSEWLRRPGCARAHHQFRLAEATLVSVENTQAFLAVDRWLAERLQLPLLKRDHMLGSAHLVLPNPVFRKLSERLVDVEGREVSIRIRPYPNRSVESLTFHLREERPDGVSTVTSVPFDGDRAIIKLPVSPWRFGVDVSCSRRGLLYHSPPAGFLRGINLNVRLEAQRRRVSVHRRGGEVDTYDSHGASDFETQTSREPTPIAQVSALSRLLLDEDHAKRAQERVDAADEERWFSGDWHEAANFIRDLIGRASSRVLIVDPYFDGECLLRFGLANMSPSLLIRVLTSRAGLVAASPPEPASTAESEPADDDKPGPTAYARASATLSKALVSLSNVIGKAHPSPISIRVMQGKKSPIHDRFLVVDDRAWLLGSSLNELGSRGTMVIRIRSYDVVPELEAAWSDATPFEDAAGADSKKVQD